MEWRPIKVPLDGWLNAGEEVVCPTCRGNANQAAVQREEDFLSNRANTAPNHITFLAKVWPKLFSVARSNVEVAIVAMVTDGQVAPFEPSSKMVV